MTENSNTISNSPPSENKNSEWKLSFSQIESMHDAYIAKLTNLTDDEVMRTGSSVFYGYHKGWPLSKIIHWYSLRSELAQEIWLKFGFQTNAEDLKKIETKRGGVKMKKTRSKNEVITNYLKQNVGQIITAKDVEQAVGISLPTFYNFLNSNRHFFKKTGTGKYTVLDPAMERAKEQGGV
jgi:hypothetical protein